MMPETQLFKTEAQHSRLEIALALTDAAEQIESGTVWLSGDGQEREVTVPEAPTFEIELERMTDSETGEQRFELEFELSWVE